jgi:apolipoprotein N-acyltransferase
MLDLVRKAASSSPAPDLIVCPETMVPAAMNRDAVNYYTTAKTGQRGMQRFYHELRALTAELNVPLLMGAPAMYEWVNVPTDKPGEYYVLPKVRFNSAYLFDPDTNTSAVQYDKIHRVPFGEYLPWVDSWPWLKRMFIRYLTPYDFDYSLSPGKEYRVFEVGGVKLATPICFEDAVARVARLMVYDGQGEKRCDLLVNLTNDGWYPGSVQGYQHVQIATFRCVELRTPMARSVNTGVSGFIDSLGRVTQQVQVDGMSQQITGFATAQMKLDNRSTLFGRVGEWPMVLLCAATLLFAAGAVTRRVKTKRR